MIKSVQKRSALAFSSMKQGVTTSLCCRAQQTAAAVAVAPVAPEPIPSPLSSSSSYSPSPSTPRIQPFFEAESSVASADFSDSSETSSFLDSDPFAALKKQLSSQQTSLQTSQTLQVSNSSSHDSIIRPKFWYGDHGEDAKLKHLFATYSASLPAPSSYTIDCSKYHRAGSSEIDPSDADLAAEMVSKYHATGLVYLQNTGLTEVSQMRRVMESLIPSEDAMRYAGGANWRNHIAPEANVYDTGAPGTAWIHYHHEMAYVRASPTMLGFACKFGTHEPRKGATFVSDQRAATKAILQEDVGKKLKEFGICYRRDLTDRAHFENGGLSELEVYNHWQQSFGTECVEQAQKEAEARGLRVEWDLEHPRWGRYMRTRFYTDAFEFSEETGENYLFASVADHHMWFDSWPGVSRLAPEERPLKITYGNDEELTREELETFVDVYDRFGLPIDWKQGELAIMCNIRWAHGRPSFQLQHGEERELGVVLGPVFERQGQRDDKW